VASEVPDAAAPVVLVVDDEALIRWSLSEGLADSGYPVRLAATGAEARQVLAELGSGPVVVLLDLRLPDVANFSLLSEIRTGWPTVPVVVMTAHGSSDDAAQALALGAYSFVSKPFDVGEMVGLVARAWNAQRPSR